MPYDTSVLFVEFFPFPPQEMIRFIEFSSTVHSTGKSKFATHPKLPHYSGPLHSSSFHPKAPPWTPGIHDLPMIQRVVFGVI
jgi:hypothetical protein